MIAAQNIHPILLGSGIPLFLTLSRQVDLSLVECRPIEGGCVYILYRVNPRDAAVHEVSKRTPETRPRQARPPRRRLKKAG